jgi:hypothetical protein
MRYSNDLTKHLPSYLPFTLTNNCDTGLATIRAINEEGELEGPKYRINPEKLKAAWVDIVTNPDLLHIQDWDDLDSIDCDNIIQILLFGKMVYG